jgi:hypothetical protein
MKKLIIILFILIHSLLGATENSKGTLSGKVYNGDNKYPITGASVFIAEIEMGAYTNEKGGYEISDIPVGTYAVTFQIIGYKTSIKTDVIIRSGRITFLSCELTPTSISISGITVQTEYFEAPEQASSEISFSNEEIRRAPGSAGDVSRIMFSLPSVAKVNDQSNNLIVRGGNPMENTFFIDNIEIPNINHFPDQGSSGGPIGILNVDFIQDVTFSTGGFSAIYGDKLSSVMQMEFRDGNTNEFDGQFDFNMAGFGGIIEGPILGKGSAMLAVKRSYLKYVVDAFDVGSSVAPEYGDVQGKITYEFNPFQKLTFLGIYSDDHNAPDQKNAQENFMGHYGNQDLYQGTWGMNLRSIWNESMYSNTALSYTSSKFDEDFYETYTGKHVVRNRTHENEIKFRTENHKRFNDDLSIDFGLDAKQLEHTYDYWLAETTNATGDTIPEFSLDDVVTGTKAGAFLSVNVNLTNRLSTTLGARGDYFSYNENLNFSPRFSCTYHLFPHTNLTAACGIYHQDLPLLLLTQKEEYKLLRTVKSTHYIIGFEHLISDDIQLVAEAYLKKYKYIPMDTEQPNVFVIDDDFFKYYRNLVDKGVAESKGIEVRVQKKLAENIYGLASATYFRSNYKALDDKWYDRDYDNRFIVSLEGGYKPNPGLEMSVRWIYAGGVPYTPIDVELSRQNHYTVLDESKVNSKRYPNYHSLNLRIDKRFFFKKTNLVIYVSVWNVYDQNNIAEYYWNDIEQKIEEVRQWGMLPILGIEYEF